MPNHSPAVISTARKLAIIRKQTKITQRMATKLWEYHFGKPISQTHMCRFEKLQLSFRNLEDLVEPMTKFIAVLPGLVEFYGKEIRKPRKQHKKFVRRSKEEIEAEKKLKAEKKKLKMMVDQFSEDYNMSGSECFSECVSPFQQMESQIQTSPQVSTPSVETMPIHSATMIPVSMPAVQLPDMPEFPQMPQMPEMPQIAAVPEFPDLTIVHQQHNSSFEQNPPVQLCSESLELVLEQPKSPLYDNLPFYYQHMEINPIEAYVNETHNLSGFEEDRDNLELSYF